MSMSLPKIKSATEYSETQSQKQLKFKKIKLNTQAGASAADIRTRFKSVKTQRLSNLQRYSTVQQQREYKNEKIHLNLLERKLLSGTYDEARETGQDLNSLKQKTDQYKVQTIQKKQQTEKLKERLNELKKEIDLLADEKNKRQSHVHQLQNKVSKQKSKTQHRLEDRNVLEHMVLDKKNISLVLQNRINEDKAYLTKLNSLSSHIDYELRQYREKSKNLQTTIDKINEDVVRQHKTRQQIMFEKQYEVERRKDDQNTREGKSKEYRLSLDEAEKQIQQKQFYGSYSSVLAHKFIARYSELTRQSLLSKYQVMENLYKKIGSYQKFNIEQPHTMVTRYNSHQQEAKEYQGKISKLQKQQNQLEFKQKVLQQKYQAQLFTTVKFHEKAYDGKQTKVLVDQDRESIQHEKQVHNLIQQRITYERTVQQISRWCERYGISFDISIKKNTSVQSIIKNFDGITKVVLNDVKALKNKEQKKKEQQDKQTINRQQTESKETQVKA